MSSASPMAATRLIKRYANRKLYDTKDSRYVTLDRVAAMVRGGDDVRIVDNRTKEDLTKVTLAQIIYEEEKTGQGRERSVGNLREFIQAADAKIRETIEGTRDASVGFVKEMVDEVHRIADDQVQGVLRRAISRVQHLQAEVGRLQNRIDELEGKLRQVAKSPEDSEVETQQI